MLLLMLLMMLLRWWAMQREARAASSPWQSKDTEWWHAIIATRWNLLPFACWTFNRSRTSLTAYPIRFTVERERLIMPPKAAGTQPLSFTLCCFSIPTSFCHILFAHRFLPPAFFALLLVVFCHIRVPFAAHHCCFLSSRPSSPLPRVTLTHHPQHPSRLPPPKPRLPPLTLRRASSGPRLRFAPRFTSTAHLPSRLLVPPNTRAVLCPPGMPGWTTTPLLSKWTAIVLFIFIVCFLL
jgi:hypothetical protein